MPTYNPLTDTLNKIDMLERWMEKHKDSLGLRLTLESVKRRLDQLKAEQLEARERNNA